MLLDLWENASITKHQESYILVFCLTWDGAEDFNVFWGIVDDNAFGSSGSVCHLVLVQIHLLSIPAITALQEFFHVYIIQEFTSSAMNWFFAIYSLSSANERVMGLYMLIFHGHME